MYMPLENNIAAAAITVFLQDVTEYSHILFRMIDPHYSKTALFKLVELTYK